MKYFILRYTIYDSEHEYDESILVKREEFPKDDEKVELFKKYLAYNWGQNITASNDDDDGSFEVEGDYRIFEFDRIEEITEADFLLVKRILSMFVFDEKDVQ